MAARYYSDEFKLDGSFAAAVAATIIALVTGFWRWLGGRKKSDTEAHASVLNGFILLLAEFKAERTSLMGRIGELERENHSLDRRVNLLEGVLVKHKITLVEP